MIEELNSEKLMVLFTKNTFNRLKASKVRFIKISGYFPKPCSSYRGMKAELNLSNYATKSKLIMRQVLIHHHLLKRLF